MKIFIIIAGILMTTSIVNSTEVNKPKKDFAESLGIEFVKIPVGSFLMGSNEKQREAFSNEKPQHKVSISKAFFMAKYEITQEQWQKLMGTDSHKLSKSNPFYGLPGMANRITKPDHPATVSWLDAQQFVKALNEKEGAEIYRLPTEAEWEYAARAGSTTFYSFGNSASELSNYAWHGEDFSSGGTHPIGQKNPNPWGLYDIHGNVWEWVQDFYSTEYYSKSPAVDPKGPTNGSGHVVRGGSWHNTSSGWHSAIRKEYDSDYRGISIGIRLVKNAQ